MKIEGEWELNPRDLAALFASKGWCYHTDKGLSVPTEADIEAIIGRLVKEVLEDPEAIGIQGGRLMVWKDHELRNSYDIFVQVGFIWDEEALGDDAEELV
ncbi:hypothetical protein [Nonomuraea jabiensis]|uniref:hypothetical protein n=1 Tax=Nonomuraea jabiensis TaxID=882448 RepID=UPI003D74E389